MVLNCVFVGGTGLWIGNVSYDVQHGHERPSICVRFQPLHAPMRRHCQHMIPQGEAILGMVYYYIVLKSNPL